MKYAFDDLNSDKKMTLDPRINVGNRFLGNSIKPWLLKEHRSSAKRDNPFSNISRVTNDYSA